MVHGLDHVAIPLPEGAEEEARAFYGGVLGLREIPKPPTLAVRGGVWFALADGRQVHLQAERDFVPLTRPHPAFVADLEELARHLEPTWDHNIPGRRRFYAFAPFGNRLEFLEP